jgi:hypothetical protein
MSVFSQTLLDKRRRPGLIEHCTPCFFIRLSNEGADYTRTALFLQQKIPIFQGR